MSSIASFLLYTFVAQRGVISNKQRVVKSDTDLIGPLSLLPLPLPHFQFNF